MKQLCVLYLCSQEDPLVLKALSFRHSVQVYRVGTDKELDIRPWDLVVFQNADVWQTPFFRKLKKVPWLFISTRRDIQGYIAPAPHLFGVVNMSGVDLTVWGVPHEMQLRLPQPVEKTADYYFYEEKPEICRIVYCPTDTSVHTNDFKLLSSLQATNIQVTLLSDSYRALATAFPPSVEIGSPKKWFSTFQKAHVVIASGQDAIRAMALGKPCVIVGDRGLGGLVTPANYETLQSGCFTGRKGGYVGEMVPSDLLKAEIRKVFRTDYTEPMRILRKKVWNTYGLKKFAIGLSGEIQRMANLSNTMKSPQKRFALKPFISSICQLQEMEGKLYIMRGMLCFGELEEEMSAVLKQCDGKTSIQELLERNGYNAEEGAIIWSNLHELWKEKLILFTL